MTVLVIFIDVEMHFFRGIIFDPLIVKNVDYSPIRWYCSPDRRRRDLTTMTTNATRAITATVPPTAIPAAEPGDNVVDGEAALFSSLLLEDSVFMSEKV